MAVALLLRKTQIHADQQLHTMVLQVTSLTWKPTCTAASDFALLQQTKCNQIPSQPSWHCLHSSEAVLMSQRSCLGHTWHRKNPSWVGTRQSTYTKAYTAMQCSPMICTPSGRAVRRGWKKAVSIHPCRLPALPAYPCLLSLPWRGATQSLGTRCRNAERAPRDLDPSRCWEGAEQSWWVVPPPLLPENTTNRRRAGERLNRSSEQLPSRQRAWLPCNVWGDPSWAHPKLLDLNNPLSHVSLRLLGPEISHSEISYLSGRLGCSALSLCSGQPAGAAVSLFPWAPPLAAPTPRSAPGQTRPLLTWRMRGWTFL